MTSAFLYTNTSLFFTDIYPHLTERGTIKVSSTILRYHIPICKKHPKTYFFAYHRSPYNLYTPTDSVFLACFYLLQIFKTCKRYYFQWISVKIEKICGYYIMRWWKWQKRNMTKRNRFPKIPFLAAIPTAFAKIRITAIAENQNQITTFSGKNAAIHWAAKEINHTSIPKQGEPSSLATCFSLFHFSVVTITHIVQNVWIGAYDYIIQ